MLAYQANASLLLASSYDSAAALPTRRRLLDAGPQVAGVTSTTVVSGE